MVLSPKINLVSISSLRKFIFDRMKNSSHVMKYFKVTNKLWIPSSSIFDKIESFRFWWLRWVFQQLISHRKDLVSRDNSLT